MADINHFGYVLASKQLVEERCPVRYMYHETPDNNDDSGWRFFSGYETVDYINNPENVGVYDINTIIDIDQSIVPFLDNKLSVFEKPLSDGQFIRVV